MVLPTHPLLSDREPFAVFVFVMMVYIQMKWFYQYSVNLRQEADRRDNRVNEMHLKNQKTLDQFASRVDVMRSGAAKMIQPLEGRLEALEVAFKKLVTLESAALKGATTRLRAQLGDSGLWGKKRQELQLLVDEAAKREAAWENAMSWA